MINELLTDKDIMNYLMTSDFDDGLTSEESKFLLLKYREVYRSLYSRHEQSKYTLEEMIKKMEDNEKQMSDNNELLKSIQNELKVEKARELTWKERFYGKKLN